MARDNLPFFPLYPAQFMTGVRGLTPAQVGVYIMLLCRIYEAGEAVEDDPAVLSAYCGMREDHFVPALERLVRLKKITRENGLLSNKRAMAEIELRAELIVSKSRAGKASAEKRQQNQRGGATPVQQVFNNKITLEDKERDTNVSPKKDAVSSVRGSRLPQDWLLPRVWGEWALGEGLGVDEIRREADRFKDYWLSLSGAKATKVDWFATWKNWIRKKSDEKSSKQSKQDRRSAFTSTIDAIADGLASGEVRLGVGSDDPFSA